MVECPICESVDALWLDAVFTPYLKQNGVDVYVCKNCGVLFTDKDKLFEKEHGK
jgi:uncharacterized protein YlaI